MNIKSIIRQELERNIEAREDLEQRLNTLPRGRLRACRKTGGVYYTYITETGEMYLGKRKPELVGQIKERKYAETALEVVTTNVKYLKALYENYRPFETGEIVEMLPETYRIETTETGVFNGRYTNARAWENAPYPKRVEWDPERKAPGHVTLKGDSVRSKSELTIANMLHSKGIPYRYEQEIQVDGIYICPDFIVYVETENKVKILEHCGMMFDRGYQADYARKVATYIAGGYMPDRDVFFTYDDKDGNLDTRLIEKIIEENFR